MEAQDPDHEPPDGIDDKTIEAVGKLSEALEWIERARGRLYDLHQMVGHADLLLDEASGGLEAAGHLELADAIRTDLIGRNVLEGRWTFQIVEEFDGGYYRAFREHEERVRGELCAGRKHIFESRMKDDRRTPGRRGHERRPDPGS